MATHVSWKNQTTKQAPRSLLCCARALLPLGVVVAAASSCGRGNVATGYYCNAGSYQPSSGATCVPVATCTADEYESAAPTATSDRECTQLTVCTSDEYETTAPTATSDRACAPLSGSPDASVELRFTRGGGFVFCIQAGQALDITIARLPDQTLQVTGKYVVLTQSRWEPTCPDGSTMFIGDICAAALVPMILTSSEELELAQLLADLSPPECEIDPGLMCDACLVPSLRFEDTRYTTYCCGTQQNPTFDAAFEAIADFIDSLMPPAS